MFVEELHARCAARRCDTRRTRQRSRSTIPATSDATPARSTSRGDLLDAIRRATISEPERNRENPYCCGAGGGLLFADKEEEPGIAHQRRALQAAPGHRRRHRRHRLPVLLDHAEGRAGERARRARHVQFVDLMTFVNGPA